MSLISTHEVCDKIINIGKVYFNINFSKEVPKRYKSKNIAIICLNGRQQMLIFLDWIYKDATVYLERKFNRYIGAKNLIVNHYNRKNEKYFDKSP